MNITAVSTTKIKAYLAKIFKGLIVVFFVGSFLLFWFSIEKPPVPKETLNEKSPIYDLTKAVDDKSLWMFKAQNQLLEQQKMQEKLMQELAELKKDVKSSTDFETIKTRIAQLEQKTNEASALSSATSSSAPLEQAPFETAPTQTFYEPSDEYLSSVTPQGSLPTSSIFSESITLPVNEQSKLPHIDSFIPPGTYTKAILLSGVDVSAGVSSQATPKPVLLRLIHKGSLPNKAFGNMKDCRIIAAAYGDLSSERAYMRLEKLSCVQSDGHVIVTDVDGYVNGEDGKNGLRGRVVTRDAEALTRGFMGGLLSGLGKATSQSYRSTSISPFGTVNTSNAKGADMFKQAGTQRAGDAFELMAKYNIQRAEQYQPVIQISAGREVDVVFHSGSQFGEKKIRKPPVNTAPTNSLPTHNIYGDNS
jgi:conjugal transfer pilus assembly protein TraB